MSPIGSMQEHILISSESVEPVGGGWKTRKIVPGHHGGCSGDEEEGGCI